MKAAMPAPAFADSDPPLWEGLGPVSYKISTSRPDAQAYFDQGLRPAYAFNHAEAQRAFRKAQKLDPSCVMCFWGEALVLGPNINLPMQEDAVQPAFAAVQKALAVSAPGEPARAGADRRARNAIRAGSEGRSRPARRRLCGSHGQACGRLPGRRRDRGAHHRLGIEHRDLV